MTTNRNNHHRERETWVWRRRRAVFPRGAFSSAGVSSPSLEAIVLTRLLYACCGFRVQGSGFSVQGSGFRVQGSGFGV